MVSVTKKASGEDLLALTQVTPTVEVTAPIYEADGRTPKTDEEGREVEFIFTLHRPNTAQGIEFGKFQRGKSKGKSVKLPSQQELSIKALRICIPDFRSNRPDEVLAVIVQTGGYLGENAVLVNACMNLLGQNFEDQDRDDQEEREERWADDGNLPTSSSS